MNIPLLSVIIPCYNNGNYLAAMLDCCLKQTFQSWEVIVIDDGSTDDTPSMVEKYTSKDNRIKYFKRDRQPKGSVVCRNIGFEKSVGKYIIHFDADDLFTETCFEDRVAYMENHPDCDYASFPAKSFREDGKLPSIDRMDAEFGIEKSGDLLQDFLTVNYAFSVWCNIYRRDRIVNYPWDETVLIYTDFSYIVPMILDGLDHHFAKGAKVDYFYRVAYSKTNMCANFVSKEKAKSSCYLFNKILCELKKREDYEERKKQYFTFVLLQSERLVVNANETLANEFFQVIGLFYPKESRQLAKIASRSIKINNDSLRLSSYYWQVANTFHISYYYKRSIRTFGKFFLRKNI